MAEYMECPRCRGRFKPPIFPLKPGEKSNTWSMVFKDEAYGPGGRVYVPKGKKFRDILIGFRCPGCGHIERAEFERDF